MNRNAIETIMSIARGVKVMLFNQFTDKLDLQKLAEIINAKIPDSIDKKIVFKRILTQPEYVEPGDIVIDAGWYNSHRVIQQSIEKGAVAVFCSEKDKRDFQQKNVIAVDNPLQCVQRFERWKKECIKVKVVAITGSVGKTTTTGMISAIFSSVFKTFVGHSMANSHGAILRNIQRIDDSYDWWIQEVGGVQPGYVESSAVILQPDIVVLTNIGDSHLNTYHTKQAIFYDKSSLERYANKDATLIIDYDDELLRKSEYTHKVITCSLSDENADYYAKEIILTFEGISFTAVCKMTGESIVVKLGLHGEHNVKDALFAIASAGVAKIPLEKIANAISLYKPSGMRQNFVNVGGYSFMVDVFNAEPKTVIGSALTLSKLPKKEGRKIFITGHIDKLGDSSKEMHKQLGYELSNIDLDIIVLFAGDSKYTYKALLERHKENVFLMKTREELDDWVRSNVTRDDIVFFKSGQFEAALVKTIDNVFGTDFQNEQQFNEGEVFYKDNFKFRIRKDNIAEVEGYIGEKSDLVVPSDYNGIPVVRIRPFAFYKNKKISSIIIPDTVVNIGKEAFYQCTNLQFIQMPSHLKIIGKNAFNYCKRLKNIIIPIETIHIDRHAFYDCVSLEQVYVPESVGYFGTDVFGLSESLKRENCKVIFKGRDNIKAYLDNNKINYFVV